MAPEASAEAAVVEPSTLEIIDIAAARTAGQPLKGKKLKNALAKAAPAVARYIIDGLGEDAIGRIIGLSLAARAADEAGDAKLAAALIDVATLLYRNEWTSTDSDPASLNAALDEAIAAAGLEGDAALTGIDPEGAENGDVAPVDAEGVGISDITQSGTANDQLAGRQFKKAMTKVLGKSGASIAGYEPGGRGVIELVLAARAADEAGDQKAAKAFMGLALVAYRAGVQARGETGAYNESIVRLVNEEYEGLPGLELWPPPGMIDVCVKPNGTAVTCVDQASPWECWGAGGKRLERMSMEEATCG